MAFPGGNIVRVTPTLDTNAYGDNEVLFDATEIPNAVSNRGGVSRLINVTMLNQNTDVIDIDIVFMQVQTNIGTINGSIGWDDDTAQAAKILGFILVDASDPINSALGAVRIFSFSGAQTQSGIQLPMLLQAEGGSTSVYFSAVLRDGTPTYAADDLDFIFHIEYLD